MLPIVVTKVNISRFKGNLLFLSAWLINAHATKQKSVSLIFGGDVSFAGIVKYLNDNGRCKGYNASFQKIKPYLKADFVIVNLENVFKDPETTNDNKLDIQPVHLDADPSATAALKFAGISHVSLANNHITDLGAEGIEYTAKILRRGGIHYFGLTHGKMLTRQKPLIVQRNGIKIGVLGYCGVANCYKFRKRFNAGMAIWDVSLAVSEIKSLRKDGCDVVIIYLHWGEEYTSMMSTGNMFDIMKIQKESPVELIVGGHPHTTHSHFYYNDTLVASSLGNLLFPSHYAGTLNFNNMDHKINATSLAMYEQLWAKQSRLIKNPSSMGKLLKVEVNRDGIIRRKTKYLRYEIFPSIENHCLVAEKMEDEDWITVCGKHDLECSGTRNCNVLECDGIIPYAETDKFVP